MIENFDQLKDKIVEDFNKRLPDLHCPACGHDNLVLMDGFFNHKISKNIHAHLVAGGSVLPTIAAVCDKCGYLVEFAAAMFPFIALNQKKETKGPDGGADASQK